MITLYDFPLSCHGHRVQLLLNLLGQHSRIAEAARCSDIAHAPEGGVSLAPYPHLRAGLARVGTRPGFVAVAVAVTRAGLVA